jgi:hypothetical protein
MKGDAPVHNEDGQTERTAPLRALCIAIVFWNSAEASSEYAEGLKAGGRDGKCP